MKRETIQCRTRQRCKYAARDSTNSHTCALAHPEARFLRTTRSTSRRHGLVTRSESLRRIAACCLHICRMRQDLRLLTHIQRLILLSDTIELLSLCHESWARFASFRTAYVGKCDCTDSVLYDDQRIDGTWRVRNVPSPSSKTTIISTPRTFPLGAPYSHMMLWLFLLPFDESHARRTKSGTTQVMQNRKTVVHVLTIVLRLCPHARC